MNYKFFLNGIIKIILSPSKAWETIDTENKPVKILRDYLFFPLIILVSISAFIGSLIFINAELSPVYSIFESIKCFAVFFVTVYLTAFILGEITYPLDLGKNFTISFRLILFSAIPFLLCQFISRAFESLLFMNIIGLYGLYIFWAGAEKMLNPPQYKKMPLLVATTIVMAGIFVVTNLVLTMFFDRIYFAYFS
jgi:hypothetical protein